MAKWFTGQEHEMVNFGNQEIVAKSLTVTYLKNYAANFNQTWQEHITVNAHCIRTRTQKVEVQDHMKPKVDSEALQRHHS